MKKKLNTDAIMNELRGASVFFPPAPELHEVQAPPVIEFPVPTSPKLPPTSHTSERPSRQASQHDSLLAEIRRTIKVQGKEVSYVRLTQEEKNQLADIIYSYKRQGVKTTETEISRIAINYLVEEFKINGQASVLARLLVLLNA